MVNPQNLFTNADRLPNRIASLAGLLEIGQAVSPLQQEAEKLADFPHYGHELTLVLVGMTPEARATVLNWLMGPQHQSVSVKLSEPLDLLEIRLQERGYVLETDFSGRNEFASPDEFLAALSQRAGVVAIDDALIEPIRLGVAAPPPLRNLTLLAPANAGIVSAAPRILSAIASRTAILVLAAPEAFPWAQEQLSAVGMIAENVIAVWPVVTNSETTTGATLQNLVRQFVPPSLPLTILPHVHSAPIPNFILAGPGYPIRQAITLSAYARRCRSLLEMIQERFDGDLRQLESRQKREARLERMIGAESKEQTSKPAIDAFKSQFGDELNRLLQGLRETSRRSLLKTGDLGQALDKLLTSLQADDLERELGQKIVKLNLKPEVLTTFRRRLAKALRLQVDEDCIMIRDSLDLLRQSAETALTEAGSTNRSLSLSAPDNRQLWETLGEALQLDIRYKGELPRRGFWQRMAEGRRIVFVAMMLLSLAGGFAGFNIRQIGAFGFVFLALFIGGVIYTYTAWNKEENEQLDKEIDKVKENMQTEFSRALNDILRDKQTRLQQILDDLKRDGLAQLDNAQKEAQRNQFYNNQNELRDAKAKLRVIEQRLKELRPLSQQIQSVTREIDDFDRDAGQWLRELAGQEKAV